MKPLMLFIIGYLSVVSGAFIVDESTMDVTGFVLIMTGFCLLMAGGYFSEK